MTCKFKKRKGSQDNVLSNEDSNQENFYNDIYGKDSEARTTRKETLLQYPIPYTDEHSTEHRWWPLSVQELGQPVVPQDRDRREKTENLRTKPDWGFADFRLSEQRQMADGADDDYDSRYPRLAFHRIGKIFIVHNAPELSNACSLPGVSCTASAW